PDRRARDELRTGRGRQRGDHERRCAGLLPACSPKPRARLASQRQRIGQIGERVMSSAPAVAASAVIMSGAALAFCLLAALNHELALPRSVNGWAVAIGIALIPTMVAISLFMAGLP